MTGPRPVCDSETMRAFEAEIERKARVQAMEQKVESTSKPEEPIDNTPFGRKLAELGFFKT